MITPTIEAPRASNTIASSAPRKSESIVTIISSHDDASVYGTGTTRMHLQKSYRFESAGHNPTHERGTWLDEKDVLASASRGIGGRWADVAGPKGAAHRAETVYIAKLSDWLSPKLQTPDIGIVLGRLKLEHRHTPSDLGGYLIDGRTKAHYADVPSRWLFVDLDDLAGDADQPENAVADFLAEYLPDLADCG